MKYAFPLEPELSFSPFQFTRNRIEHIIAAADPADYPNRQTLRYELTLNAPEYPGMQLLEPLLTLPSREKPALINGGQSTYEGAKFTMQAELDGLLTREKPVAKQSQISVISSLTTPYNFTEVIKNNGVEIRNQALSPQWAIKSGLSELDHDGWGSAYWTYYHKNRFLTWQPDNKTVCKTQEEYLYFLLNFTPVPSYIRLRVDVTFTDTSINAFYPIMPVAGVSFGQVLCIPVGPAVVLPEVSKPIANYQVYLVDQFENRLSEIKTYWLDQRIQRQERSVLFSNSFQVYDTFRLVGESTESHKVQRFYADRERPIGAGLDFSDLFMIDKVGERELTISTGYFEPQSGIQRYLSEIILAEEWYLITDKGHEPLELVTSSQVSSQDNPSLISRQYQFRHIREASNFSALPTPPVFPSREVYWKPTRPQFTLNAFGKRTGYVRYARLSKTYRDTDMPFIPVTTKANLPGDPDFVAELRDPSVIPGSTPFPNAVISRLSSFTRSNCETGYMGGPFTIVIPADKYGGENPGESDVLAMAEFNSLNTQASANRLGSCVVNNTPLHLSILHKIPMDLSLKAVGSDEFGPVVRLILNDELIIPNTIGSDPAVARPSDNTIMPGKYVVSVGVAYVNYPAKVCRIRLLGKNKEMVVAENGIYSLGEITINSNDDPLTLEVI